MSRFKIVAFLPMESNFRKYYFAFVDEPVSYYRDSIAGANVRVIIPIDSTRYKIHVDFSELRSSRINKLLFVRLRTL